MQQRLAQCSWSGTAWPAAVPPAQRPGRVHHCRCTASSVSSTASAASISGSNSSSSSSSSSSGSGTAAHASWPHDRQHQHHGHRSAPAPAVTGASAHEARCIGALLGAMAGNALGHPVNHEPNYRVTRLFPNGLTDFFSFDPAARTPPPPGTTSGDFLQLPAVTRALLAAGRADLFAILDALVESYSPDRKDYSPYTGLVLDALSQGANPFALPRQADLFLDLTTSRLSQSTSDRPERQPYGPSDNGAVVRTVPLGLAYRHAAPQVMRAAVESVTVFSHPHPGGKDGALVQAAAVAWLCRADMESPDCTPAALLDVLLDTAQTADMRQHLLTISRAAQRLGRLPVISSASGWRQLWRSKEWRDVATVNNWLTRAGYATEGRRAVAVALWALVCNWEAPEQAVEVAASLGGSAGATATLTGALAGALHGCEWVPARWWHGLHNDEHEGRDAVVQLARQLAILDCREVVQAVSDVPELQAGTPVSPASS